MTLIEKLNLIFKNTKNVNGCLEWLGNRYRQKIKGKYVKTYPSIFHNGKHYRGHRLVWTLVNGSIPEGLGVLHKCDNNVCINPDHLYLGTQKQNIQDAVKRRRHMHSRKTHCPAGHPYLGENLFIDMHGKRYCKSCRWYRNNSLSIKRKLIFSAGEENPK